MWQSDDVLIISDLHLAAERGKGLFRADAELAEFLNWVCRETDGGLLLLNGDILDYLIVEKGVAPAEAFDLTTAQPRTADLITFHPEVFDALAEIVGSTRHQVVMVSGNHDPELSIPEVQQTIEARLDSARPGPPVRWLTLGTAARVLVGPALVIVEHGNDLDPWNIINFDKLGYAVRLLSRGLNAKHGYKPPSGSELVVTHLTDLREDYPWVDLLKPEREAVFPLLRHFMSPMQQLRFMTALKNWFWSLEASAVSKYRAAFNPPARYRAAGDSSPARERFKQWLLNYESGGTRGIVRPGAASLIEELRQASAEDSFFEIGEHNETGDDVRYILEQGADVVVHGHTHSAKAYTLGPGLYLNSGTWGRLLRLPMSYDSDEVWQQFLDKLKPRKKAAQGGGPEHAEEAYESFLRPTFARITRDPSSGVVRASLQEWQKTGPRTLSSWRFLHESRAWRKEVGRWE
jgi:UDP-2,3-diacylglucosamine pyrophosphatase LpxH